MKRIWRLELEDGNGPYFPFAEGGEDLHAFIGLPLLPERHPEPGADFANYFLLRLWFLAGGCIVAPRDARFGFASLKQYRQWFFTDAARRNLSRMGAQLICYAVEEGAVLQGCRQVAFDRYRARRIECRNPAQFHRFVGRQLELF